METGKGIILSLCVCALVLWVAVSWGGDTFLPGETVPGHVLSPPHGGRSEIKAEGLFAGGDWTVILTRSQTTTWPTQDVQFDLSSQANLYDFSVAILNNEGGNPGTMELQDSEGYTLGNETSLADLKASPVTTPPSEEADFVGPALVTDPDGSVAPATLKAAYDSKNVYIFAKWTDAGGSASLAKDRWTFDGSNWSQSGNEDRIALMFNINASDWGGCGVYCHVGESPGDGGRMRTNNPGQTLDMWHWKAARSNPMQAADDKYVIYDDPAGGLKTRKGDDGSAVDSANKNGIGPKFVAENDPGANATFLVELLMGSKRAVPFDTNAGWLAGDTIPGNVLSPAWSSRSEIKAAGSFEAAGDVWRVILSRAHFTNTLSQDVQFDLSSPTNLYDFSVAIFNNEGGNPETMAPQDDDGYTLGNETSLADLKASPVTTPPTEEADFTGPALVTDPGGSVAPATLKAAYDSKSLYIFAKWTDAGGSASLAKDRWTFNGSSWSQAGNEDRIAIMFNVNATDWAGCGVYCHVGESPGDGGRMRTNNPGETVDMWHWKAARSNPMQVADDKYVIYDDPAGGLNTRKGDDGDAVDSKNDDGGSLPELQAVNDPGADATFLIDMPAGAERAVLGGSIFVDGFESGDTSAWTLQQPSP